MNTISAVALALLFAVVRAQDPPWWDAPEIYQFHADGIWPLCGRIHEFPPVGWNETQGCPPERFGDPAYADDIRSTYGPRPLKSEGERYDFHRGLDISAPVGTAMFAIADGTVEHFGPKSGYNDPVIIVVHKRPNQNACGTVGCYRSLYLHARADCCPTLTLNQPVLKGDFLGYSGASGSGYAHLHFEIRSSPPVDPYSNWQRDAIHPLNVLPYSPPPNSSSLYLSPSVRYIGGVAKGRISLVIDTQRKDIKAFRVRVEDKEGREVVQPGNTPDAKGYQVEPSSFDFEEWNYQWSHKDSSSVPWSAFNEGGGAHECPYRHQHGSGYSAHYHMDAHVGGNEFVGTFNGITVQLQDHAYYSPSGENSTAHEYVTGRYFLNVSFDLLHGLDASTGCVEGEVEALDGWTVRERMCFNHSASPFASIQTPFDFPWGFRPHFDYPECRENRTWIELFEQHEDETELATGGLGSLITDAFEVWVCLKDHPCHERIDGGRMGWMCYAFNEQTHAFEPWGREEDLRLLPPPP
mmetsp:Transcript_33342/g.68831  ORF Transcript_33342/g.68831 Transcript_33342/m.68831 type:complete len:523 (-) Transcript_33342:84-1652(-)